MSNHPVLEAAGLEAVSSWSGRSRVAGVDWTVQPGEYWVIGGRHGSGKTDLLMTTAGLHQPAAGSLRLFGQSVIGVSGKELLQQRTRVGFVFKNGGRMFNELTVAENVGLGICYHRNWTAEQAQGEVNAVLEAMELTGLAEETAQTLGIEWQQRVGLARALALKPEVLFLDEPAAGLAPHHRQWWRNFLSQLSTGSPLTGGKKITVIAATNDFGLWHGGNHRYALVKDRRWHILGTAGENPEIE